VTPTVEINSAALTDCDNSAKLSDELIEHTLIVEGMSDYSEACSLLFQGPPDNPLESIERSAIASFGTSAATSW
jgi:hypothetical protein